MRRKAMGHGKGEAESAGKSRQSLGVQSFQGPFSFMESRAHFELFFSVGSLPASPLPFLFGYFTRCWLLVSLMLCTDPFDPVAVARIFFVCLFSLTVFWTRV